ncbi:predicted protein [Uncinocarpus reesii 1704]|uniref:MACPF-like domain-containing protein n=1 Tax=Uncinocarpus reesii (strain UAMH 1704) TaxID=336963 RepID=C4JEX1_UNCRE|nr:uncharacterized protein UREG_00871 [Uncinocarpus reesii 1704]EEP76024.1 predicted protein [Uncinocarpus reesii 1704]
MDAPKKTAAPSATTSMTFNIFLYDPQAEVIKNHSFATVDVDTSSLLLSGVREALIKKKALDWSFAEGYADRQNIYFKWHKFRTGLDDDTKEFVKGKLDLLLPEHNPQGIDRQTVKELISSFDPSRWQAVGSDKPANASAMSEDDWKMSTKLSLAFTIAKKEESQLATETTTEDDLDPVDLKIPLFQVTDSSFVEVMETKSFISTMLAGSTFSQTDVEASVGGGFGGFSGAVKAGLSTSDQKVFEQSTQASTAMMHISYNFPRVTLHLDRETLQVRKQCVDDLKGIDSHDKFARFHEKYGHIFPQKVLLGGCLYFQQYSDSFGEVSTEAKSKSLKAAASLSFSSPYVQAEVSASHANSESSTSGENKSDFRSSLTWHAHGGNTLLCNNPPEWCGTVGDFQNWRIVQQRNPIALLSFLRSFSVELRDAVDKALNYRD